MKGEIERAHKKKNSLYLVSVSFHHKYPHEVAKGKEEEAYKQPARFSNGFSDGFSLLSRGDHRNHVSISIALLREQLKEFGLNKVGEYLRSDVKRSKSLRFIDQR